MVCCPTIVCLGSGHAEVYTANNDKNFQYNHTTAIKNSKLILQALNTISLKAKLYTNLKNK